MTILKKTAEGTFDERDDADPVSTDDILFLQETVRRVYVDDAIKNYIVAIINTTRGGGPRPIPGFLSNVRVGSSPRGASRSCRSGRPSPCRPGATT